ncbi:MAG TPA: hypothetical protein VE911_02790 [Candidatus Nitrosopolaris sp.]|nr:hypothetical protein [Candidatus Nitrosopolaris sp.]
MKHAAFAVLGVLALVVGTAACQVHIATLSAASTRRLADVARAATPRGLHEGRSCRWWFLGVPFGLPQLDEAVAAAVQPVGGTVLRNLTVSSDHTVYVLFGQHCYTVRGEVLG